MYCCEMYVVYGAIIWFHMMVCSMRDITNEETEREKKEQITRQTVEVADKVVGGEADAHRAGDCIAAGRNRRGNEDRAGEAEGVRHR